MLADQSNIENNSDDVVDVKATGYIRHKLYYQAQLPFLRESVEWDSFHDFMCKELNVSIRISSFQPLICNGLHKILLSDRWKYDKSITAHIIEAVNWLPKTYRIMLKSSQLSKQLIYQTLHSLILREVALGNIVRQELVSMIPVLLLQIDENEIVLDMCAAPGSKTEQIISSMMNSAANKQINMPRGIVIANDSDPKRLSTLIDRIKSSCYPFVVFTCLEAQQLPSLLSINSPDEQIFDKIVCDVPCSGDGTFRKCPHLWRLFRPRISLEFHSLQLMIASAGIRLLKTGGRMAYSTCSLNPIEDEAVVAALLREFHGVIRLVNVRHGDMAGVLPHMKYREGVSTWRYDSEVFVLGEDDLISKKESLSRLPIIPSTVHPPSSDESSWMNLHYCLRLLPQDQNTGGFFVAIFEKIKPNKNNTKNNSKQFNSSDKQDIVHNNNNNNIDINNNSLSLQIVNDSSKSKDMKKSKNKSLSAMKRLGYNPKLLKEKHTNKKEINKIYDDSLFYDGPLLLCANLATEAIPMLTNQLNLSERYFSNSSNNDEMTCDNNKPTNNSDAIMIIYTLKTSNPTYPNNNIDSQINNNNTSNQPVKKIKTNGVFGSKTNGWSLTQNSNDSSAKYEIIEDASDPSYLCCITARVYQIIKSWGMNLMIVQMGTSFGQIIINNNSKTNRNSVNELMNSDLKRFMVISYDDNHNNYDLCYSLNSENIRLLNNCWCDSGSNLLLNNIPHNNERVHDISEIDSHQHSIYMFGIKQDNSIDSIAHVNNNNNKNNNNNNNNNNNKRRMSKAERKKMKRNDNNEHNDKSDNNNDNNIDNNVELQSNEPTNQRFLYDNIIVFVKIILTSKPTIIMISSQNYCKSLRDCLIAFNK
eukprot:gene12085-16172_t